MAARVPEPAGPVLSARLPITAGVTLLATALMAWDHLWGNERGPRNSFPVDPGVFFLTFGLIVASAIIVFGFTVRRYAPKPESVHRAALAHSGAALVIAVPAAWLGFPVVLAGGGIALGLQAMNGPHRRLASAAFTIGVLVLVFCIMATAFPPSDS